MAETSPVQLVDADGEFRISDMDDFAKSTGLLSAGLNYQMVAIMGPQSSGKSTLLNHVFGTRFQEMNAETGRRQTTRGIWMARSPEHTDVVTVVLDLEGTDGRERGEDDTTFERQSALFALAVSDVVVINIWCHDIGREHGSGKPLIKTILQVNLKLFTPSPNRKKTVLVFAIRDKSKTPLERLTEVLEQDMLRIWDSIVKPAEYEATSFHDFFEVHFEALPNYEEKEEEFITESRTLHKKFTLEGKDTYVRLEGKLPGDAIPLSVSKVWEVIKSHKDLDLPAHKIMVATTRCSQIQHDQLEGLTNDHLWENLLKDVSERLHEDFGERMSSLVDSCLTGYDEDTLYFDAEIRAEKREELVEKVTNLVKGPFEQQMKFLHQHLFEQMEKDLKIGTTVDGIGFSDCSAACREEVRTAFIEKRELLEIKDIPFDTSPFQKEFMDAVDAHIGKLKKKKLEEVKTKVEESFSASLSAPAVDLFENTPTNLWVRAYQILESAVTEATSLKNKELFGYVLTNEETEQLESAIKDIAVHRMKTHAKEAANTVLSRMKDKFSNEFSLDENQIPRTWTAKDNITQISKAARLSSAEVLAALAIFQVPDAPQQASKIEDAIRAMARRDFDPNASTAAKNGAIDINVAVQWPETDADRVLLQPSTVRSCWKQFMTDTKLQITQATLTQQANKLASNRMPPIWAIFAMLFLGFNEFMAVVYSPVMLLCLIVVILFVRSLYIEMDVDNELQKGALPGAVSLAGKFVPSVKTVSSKTIDSVMSLMKERAHALQTSGEAQPVAGSSGTSSVRQRVTPHEGGNQGPSDGAVEEHRPVAEESAKDK